MARGRLQRVENGAVELEQAVGARLPRPPAREDAGLDPAATGGEAVDRVDQGAPAVARDGRRGDGAEDRVREDVHAGHALAELPEEDGRVGRVVGDGGRERSGVAGEHAFGIVDEDAVAAQQVGRGVHRDLMTMLMRRGRHAEAARRHDLLRRRYRKTFGSEPPFELAEITQQPNSG